MKVLSLIVMMLWCGSVMAQEPLSFNIKGDVSSVKPEVKLVKLSYTVDGVTHKDSAWVKNGQYSFSGTLTEPRMGYFSLQYVVDSLNKKLNSRRDNFSVYLDKGNIQVTSTDSFSNRKVAGSKAHEIFEMLAAKEKAYDPQFEAIYAEMQNAKNDPAKRQMLEDRADSLDDVVKEAVYGNYFKANFNSPMALYALNTYAGYMMDPVKVEPLYNQLPEKVKKSFGGQDFLSKLEGAKRLRVGMMATDFTQNDTTGKAVSFSSFRGKYVLVDFWASWCGPCRRENPNVVAAFNQYKSKNFTVLGVALEREGEKDRWLKAINKDGLTWTHVSDFGYFNNAVAKLYGINAIARNFLVDPNGKIIATDLRGEALQKKLQEVLQ